jgi:hypothetical protein
MLSRLLHADLPPRGVWPWDLRLRDGDDVSNRTRIEVRSGATSVSIDGGRDAHVWIVVRKSNESGDRAPVSYCVAPTYRVRELRNSVRKPALRTVEQEFGVVTTDELAAAVSSASVDERRHSQ